MTKKNVNKTVLVILDGWGIRNEIKGNAIAQANTPFYEQMLRQYPMTQLQASSGFVGLPEAVMGNSEVGHMNIGAGKVIAQDLVRINESLANKTFTENKSFQSMLTQHKATGRKIHLLGLISDGCVHSSEEHYSQIIQLLFEQGADMKKVYFHAILDGRDTSPRSALQYIKNLQAVLNRWGGQLASLSGRFFAMDRDQRWERTAEALKVMLDIGSNKSCTDPIKAIEKSYEQGISDEFFEPCKVLTPDQSYAGKIEEHDVVFCFNFRSDRMRQICKALTEKTIKEQCLQSVDMTDEGPLLDVSKVFTMTRYSWAFAFPVLFDEQKIDMCLGETIESHHLKQFRVAETEKYAHVTFFLNGGREEPYREERRYLVPSPKVKTYDEVPAMNSSIVTDHVCSAIEQKQEHLIVVNYAQPDMIGHTGNFEAALKAVEATDTCLERIAQAALENDYKVFVTADHGNIEQMLDDNGNVHTAHTLNPVPFILLGRDVKNIKLQSEGVLSNIAPTILQTMNIKVPIQMKSKSLLSKK
ncbi:MAG TPA: 2,3-bisphosphoglycerate-independent phosphoglycerate mutase [Oligoflexia bacterium]|nr:2,3-bisphosphoglycerate-independent phosphoglycerate mutase [Oligoflexia bacterium]HMR24813.1 2,3-bisphosphoglycerate-independent phosphoglycerate mutase [Oligoflexia bacterium]